MRTVLVVLVVVVLSCVFLVQKRHEQKPDSASTAVRQAATPRPVSEHDWAKHALDTARKVTRQVEEQRKEDPTR